MNYRNIVFALLVVGAITIYRQRTSRNDVRAEVISHVREYTTAEESVGSNSFDFDFDFDFDQSFQDSEVVLETSFDVDNGDLLSIDIEHSNLVVESSARGKLNVRVVLEGRNMERAREFYESLNYSVDKVRGGVEITADHRRRANWSWNSENRAKITVFVQLPRQFNYDILMSHGDAELDEISGDAKIYMSHGDLKTNSIDGDEVEVKLSHGDYEGGNIIANNVLLRSSHGDIDVQSIESQSTEATLSHGDISVEMISGDMEMNNSHGDIEVGVTNIGDVRFSNSHGDVNITGHDGLSADIDFSGARVHLSSDLSFDGTLKNDYAEGSVNGGGSSIRARTSHGSIYLRTK